MTDCNRKPRAYLVLSGSQPAARLFVWSGRRRNSAAGGIEPATGSGAVLMVKRVAFVFPPHPHGLMRSGRRRAGWLLHATSALDRRYRCQPGAGDLWRDFRLHRGQTAPGADSGALITSQQFRDVARFTSIETFYVCAANSAARGLGEGNALSSLDVTTVMSSGCACAGAFPATTPF